MLLGNPGLGSLGDMAYDPIQGDFVVLVFLGDVYRVDPTTMAATLIGTPGATDLNALEIDDGGNYYARGFTGTELWSVNPATGGTNVIGDTGSDSSGDLAIDDQGLLLGTTGNEDVDEIDPLTGAATILGPTGLGEFAYGIEVDLDGTIYLITVAGNVHTYDRSTSTTSFIGGLGLTDGIWGAAFQVNPSGGDLIGTNYCGPANLNSSGQPAVISAFGHTDVVKNQVRLDAAQMPTHQFGYFVNSMTQGFSSPPGSQGNLCVSGAIGRHTAGVQSTGAAGEFSLQLDLTDIPTPGGQVAIQAGETWYWQAWFRDANPSSTSNFTDGLCVTFQ